MWEKLYTTTREWNSVKQAIVPKEAEEFDWGKTVEFRLFSLEDVIQKCGIINSAEEV